MAKAGAMSLLGALSRMGDRIVGLDTRTSRQQVEDYHGWTPAGMSAETFVTSTPQFSAGATPDKQLKSVIGVDDLPSRAFLRYGPIQQILGTFAPGLLAIADHIGGFFQNGGAGVFPNIGQSGPGLAASIGAGLVPPAFGAPLVRPPYVGQPTGSGDGGAYSPRHDTFVNVDSAEKSGAGAGAAPATPPGTTPGAAAAAAPGTPATPGAAARPGAAGGHRGSTRRGGGRTGRGGGVRSPAPPTPRPSSLTLDQARQQMPELTDKMIQEAQGFVNQLEKEVQKMPEGDKKKAAFASLAQAKGALQQASTKSDAGEKFAMASEVVGFLNRIARGLSPSLMQAYNAAGGAADVVTKADVTSNADKASADAAEIGKKASDPKTAGAAAVVMRTAEELKKALQSGDPEKIRTAIAAFEEAKQKLKAATGDKEAPTPTHGAADPARPAEKPAKPATVEPPPPSAEKHAAVTADASPDGGVEQPAVAQNPSPPPAEMAPPAGREEKGAESIPTAADERAAASAVERPVEPAPARQPVNSGDSAEVACASTAGSNAAACGTAEAAAVQRPPAQPESPKETPTPPPPVVTPQDSTRGVASANLNAQVESTPQQKPAVTPAVAVRTPEPPAKPAPVVGTGAVVKADEAADHKEPTSQPVFTPTEQKRNERFADLIEGEAKGILEAAQKLPNGAGEKAVTAANTALATMAEFRSACGRNDRAASVSAKTEMNKQLDVARGEWRQARASVRDAEIAAKKAKADDERRVTAERQKREEATRREEAAKKEAEEAQEKARAAAEAVAAQRRAAAVPPPPLQPPARKPEAPVTVARADERAKPAAPAPTDKEAARKAALARQIAGMGALGVLGRKGKPAITTETSDQDAFAGIGGTTTGNSQAPGMEIKGSANASTLRGIGGLRAAGPSDVATGDKKDKGGAPEVRGRADADAEKPTVDESPAAKKFAEKALASFTTGKKLADIVRANGGKPGEARMFVTLKVHSPSDEDKGRGVQVEIMFEHSQCRTPNENGKGGWDYNQDMGYKAADAAMKALPKHLLVPISQAELQAIFGAEGSRGFSKSLVIKV